jgi:hypothetical protein
MGEKLIGACGLGCSECEAYTATRANDGAQIEIVAQKWSRQFGTTIAADSVWCDGCMTAGPRKCGHCAECEIRSCVAGKALSNCSECAEYACDKLAGFLAMMADSGARETLEALRAEHRLS